MKKVFKHLGILLLIAMVMISHLTFTNALSADSQPVETAVRTGEPAKAAGGSGLVGAGAQKSLRIRIYDLDGNLLSNSAIGNGTTIYYYELPMSEMHPSGSTPEEYSAYIRHMIELIDEKKKPLQVTGQGDRFTLTMEDDASADNPYYVGFFADNEPYIVEDPSNLYPSVYERIGDWYMSASLQYDGTDITSMSGATVQSDGTVDLALFSLSGLVQPTITFSTDFADYAASAGADDDPAYPVYAEVYFTGMLPGGIYYDNDGQMQMGYRSYSQRQIIEITSDGQHTVTLPEKVMGNVSGSGHQPESCSITFYTDSQCSDAISSISSSYTTSPVYYQNYGRHQFYVNVQPDGSVKYYDPSNGGTVLDQFGPTFTRKVFTLRPSFFIFFDDPSGDGAEDFPLYVRVSLNLTLEDGSSYSMQDMVYLESEPNTVQGPMTITLGEKVPNFTSGYISLSLTSDTNPTVYNNWQMSYNSNVTITPDGQLMTSGGSYPLYVNVLNYNVRPKLTVSSSSAFSSDYPIWLKLTIHGREYYNKEYSEELPLIKIEANGSFPVQFTEKRNCYNYYSYGETYIDYEVVNEDGSHNDDWDTKVTDRRVYLGQDGYLRESNYGSEMTVVNLVKAVSGTEIPLFNWLQEEDGYFPATMNVEIYDSSNHLAGTGSKVLQNLEDANSSIYVDGAFLPGQNYTVKWTVSHADDHGSFHKWYPGEAHCTFNNNFRMAQGDTNFVISYGKMVVPMVFHADHLGISHEDFQMDPTYVKLRVYYGSMPSSVSDESAYAVGTATVTKEDLDQEVSIDLGYLMWSSGSTITNNEMIFTYQAFRDAQFTEDDPSWVNSGIQYFDYNYAGFSRNGYVARRHSDNRYVYYANWRGVPVSFNAHVVCGEGMDPNSVQWKYVRNNYTEWEASFVLRIYKNGTNGIEELNGIHQGNWNSNGDRTGWTRAVSAFGDFVYNVGYLVPGVYRITWYKYNVSSLYAIGTYANRDKNWTAGNEVTVIVGNDGSFTFEDGSPADLTIEYVGNSSENWVEPVLNVDTKLPYVPQVTGNIRIEFKGNEESNREIDWYIQMNDLNQADNYNEGTMVELHAMAEYEVTSTASNGNGVLVGSVLSGTRYCYNISLKPGKYLATYYDTTDRGAYSEGVDIPVVITDGGMIYLQDDSGEITSEPFVINHHLRTLDALSIKVKTTVDPDVEHAFTAGDKVYAALYLGTVIDSSYNYNNIPLEDLWPLAFGEAEITEAGTIEIPVTPLPGAVVTSGNGKVQTFTYQGRTLSGYTLMIATFHDDGSVNSLWNWDITDATIADDGTISLRRRGSYYYNNTFDDYFDNKSYLTPYPDPTEAPDSVSSADEGIVFKPMDSINQISDKAHYVIAGYNPFDGKWYALAYDPAAGNEVILEGFDPASVSENGFLIPESSLSSAYVLTANKTNYSESAVTVQFKTGVKDASGKNYSMKFGTNSENVLPLFDTSAGTLTINGAGSINGMAAYQIRKNTYAQLVYVNQWFGFQGFDVFGNKYMKYEYCGRENIDGKDYTIIYYPNDPYTNYYVEYDRFINSKPVSWMGTNSQFRESLVYEMDPQFETQDYLNELYAANGTNYKPYLTSFVILTDNTTPVEEPLNNEYKLVKTLGDFVYNFIQGAATHKSMVLVYTDENGKEFTLNPKGLVQVQTEEIASEYRKLTCGSDNEMIVNNECRMDSYPNYGETYFGFGIGEATGDNNKEFITHYPFRKNRVNTYSGGEYLTLNGSVFTANDTVHDDSIIYAMIPTAEFISEADFYRTSSYRLMVRRGGTEKWLGVENGKMVIVDSIDDAVVFDLYCDNHVRYFPDASSTDYFPYYKINSLDDIIEEDEILIVYDNGDRKVILTNMYDYRSSYYTLLAPWVSDEYSEYDTAVDYYKTGYNYSYRLNSADTVKKVFAYYGNEEKDMIYSQMLVTHLLGNIKGNPTKKQKKFYSISAINAYYDANNRLTLKSDGKGMYRSSDAEISVIYENGQFYLRGGKEYDWLGGSTYSITDNSWNAAAGTTLQLDTFNVAEQADRLPIEIYRKGSVNTINIVYHDQDGSTVTESKSEGIIALAQYPDQIINDEDYIFVGWTTDPDKAGLLSMEDSANIYDFNDVSRVASVNADVREKLGLLGNCNPEKANTVKVKAEDLEDSTLHLYAVYAYRGRTTVVTADDEDMMIIGIADMKDLQGGASGQTDPRERWLGSIDIEIYKDGELWVPISSTTVPVQNASHFNHAVMRAGANETAKMYFAYHNDDAADINIKFIAESVTKEMLAEYLRSDDFSAVEPSAQYVIDAVYAVQGGSEDGLLYRYNWLDENYGGQLDNVKGGSAVKVYVTTRYQAKYYFDKGDGNGYVELTSDPWKDENFYMTPGTDDAIAANEEEADYIVKADNEYSKLIEKTPNDSDRFYDDNIRRGEYSYFQYEFNTHINTFPVPQLPEAPDGMELESDVWTILDENMAAIGTHTPETDFTITGTTYGTGNTSMSYTNEDYDDVTNTFHFYIRVKQNDVISIPVSKQWLDNDDENAVRPSEIVVTLYANGEPTDRTLTLKPSEWSGVFENLPITDDEGQEIEYTIEELYVEGYSSSIAGDQEEGFVITNTELISISGLKSWNDVDDQDGLRPQSITVNLLVGEEVIDSVEVTADDGWQYEFTNLPRFDEDGNEIEYSIKEEPVEGYEPIYDGNDIINSHEPAVVSIAGTKSWDDNDDSRGLRPKSITVILLADGEEIDRITVTADDDWKYEFTNLPQYAAGVEIIYTIQEEAVTDYSAAYEGYDITNTYTPGKTAVNGVKSWDDNGDAYGARPESITVWLLADGERIASVTVTAEDEWKYSFTDLDILDVNGNEITYTVEEETVEGYTVSYSGTNITNRYDMPKTQIEGSKIWDDNNDEHGVRPDSITVWLLANGERTASVTVTAEDDWKFSFTDLDVYDENGEEIVYEVEEDKVENYVVSITREKDSFIITNTYHSSTPPTGDHDSVGYWLMLFSAIGLAMDLSWISDTSRRNRREEELA